MTVVFDQRVNYALYLNPLAIFSAGQKASEAWPVCVGRKTLIPDHLDFWLGNNRCKLPSTANAPQIDQRSGWQRLEHALRKFHKNASR